MERGGRQSSPTSAAPDSRSPPPCAPRRQTLVNPGVRGALRLRVSKHPRGAPCVCAGQRRAGSGSTRRGSRGAACPCSAAVNQPTRTGGFHPPAATEVVGAADQRESRRSFRLALQNKSSDAFIYPSLKRLKRLNFRFLPIWMITNGRVLQHCKERKKSNTNNAFVKTLTWAKKINKYI